MNHFALEVLHSLELGSCSFGDQSIA
jgi:hypothetical protein